MIVISQDKHKIVFYRSCAFEISKTTLKDMAVVYSINAIVAPTNKRIVLGYYASYEQSESVILAIIKSAVASKNSYRLPLAYDVI